MSKNEILSSAMAEEEINKLTARRNEIASTIEEKRTAFAESDVETRDALLNEVEELENEVPNIDKQIGELEEIRSKFEEQEKRMELMETVSTKEVEARAKEIKSNVLDSVEYKEAWVESIKRNDVTIAQKVLRDDPVYGLATTNDNVPVPTIWQSYVETAWYNYGKFSRLVTKSYIAGYLSIPFEASATGASVHTEGAQAQTEEQIVLGLIELKPAMIKKWINCASFA